MPETTVPGETPFPASLCGRGGKGGVSSLYRYTANTLPYPHSGPIAPIKH